MSEAQRWEYYREFGTSATVPEEIGVRKASNGQFVTYKDYSKLEKEVARLKRGDFIDEEFQNLCHNLDEKKRAAFFVGCEAYQKKLFGCSVLTLFKNRMLNKAPATHEKKVLYRIFKDLAVEDQEWIEASEWRNLLHEIVSVF